MDTLFKIIKSFKKEEVRSFKLSAQKYDLDGETKAIQMFDMVRANIDLLERTEDESSLVNNLFPTSNDNLNAYYRLKNRLKKDLEKALLSLNHDIDEKISLMNLINLANIFTYKSEYELAIQYLKKAEKIAEKAEMYDLLDIVYNEILQLSHEFTSIDPLQYVEKVASNQKMRDLAAKADHTIAVLKYKLKQTNFTRSGSELLIELDSIVNGLNIENQEFNSPKLTLRIHITLRDALLLRNDFAGLEEYLIKSLKEFESTNFFNKANHPSKINLITWIINALMINKKFEESFKYSEILYSELQKYNKLFYDQYSWTYYQSRITILMSSCQIDQAMKLLEEIKELPQHKGVPFYDFAILGNLSLCYFLKQKLSPAIKTLNELLTKEKFVKHSTEQQFSLLILEAIFHFENKNFDYSEYKISELRSKFKVLLKRPEFSQDKEFLKIFSQIIQKPLGIKDEQIKKSILEFISQYPQILIGSSKYVEYNLWLGSLIKGQPYLSTLEESLGIS